MSYRRPLALVALILSLALVTACGKADKAMDTAGLTLGKDVSNLLGEVTGLLGGITNLESAKTALPQLTDLDGNLGELIDKAAKLSPESKQSLAGLVKGALPAFKTAAARVSTMEGVGETIKPILDSMLAKVNGMM